ncbi:type II toxin-antitoxin system HicA family toxin [Larkinella rosea]|uniref:Type II toxin-antitoxin system HicA family toxin n=1 Tax=Larkinella rosea TaxID=2025312 RepID=A0A3P1BJ14_9BACT|nr:type II toxin-antitoxin system HicA family toxin [Larkinella rosea]RRB01028.1 type II toxin-antitoxin system HicA family toxin [Larkinella rosea]
MKIPRDLTGIELIHLLKPLGYRIIRQSGSHIRIETEQNGSHHETIPRHNPLKVGTLNAILNNIANHFGITKEELVRRVFG